MLKRFLLIITLPLLSASFLSCGNPPKQQEKKDVQPSAEYRGCERVITNHPYNIPEQRFDITAQQLAHNSGCFIETDLSETGAIQVGSVKGKISIFEAVQMAIKDTKLEITEVSSEKIVVELVE